MKIDSPPLTIKETQDGLYKKDFSVVDLVDSYLTRIEKHDEEINAFNTVTKDKAFKSAKRGDKLIEDYGNDALKENPLLGVVVAHKDLFLTKGVRTTASSKVLDSYIPQYSSTVVKKLSNSGSVMIGKLNCDAWAHGSSGENSDYGPTKNPWNLDYVPGGSSSGSGASVAANFTQLSTGTDTCGSVRLPANYCGVVGLKPTYGAVSRYGIIAMASSLDSVGHFCHTVKDSETVFNITKGSENKDSNIDTKFIKSKNVDEITVGIPKEFFIEGLSNDIAKNIDEVVEVYKKLGVKVKEVGIPHMKFGISVYYIIQPAEVSSNLGRYDGIRYGNDRSSFGDEAKRRIMLGTYVLSAGYYDAYYKKAMEVRAKIIQEVDEVFDKVDALIAPVAPTPPFKLGEKVDDPLQMYLTDIYAATANLSGIPGIAIPSGRNKDNLPLGYQLMAPRFAESTLFELGKAYQKEVEWKPESAIK